jgi:RecJ-like exonuclease
MTGRYLAVGSMTEAAWCDHCGGALGADEHDRCGSARLMEPPRFCPYCRRRLKVQVLPAGWRALCVEHGETCSG